MRGSGASAGEEYPSDVLEGFLDVLESPGWQMQLFHAPGTSLPSGVLGAVWLWPHPCPRHEHGSSQHLQGQS